MRPPVNPSLSGHSGHGLGLMDVGRTASINRVPWLKRGGAAIRFPRRRRRSSPGARPWSPDRSSFRCAGGWMALSLPVLSSFHDGERSTHQPPPVDLVFPFRQIIAIQAYYVVRDDPRDPCFLRGDGRRTPLRPSSVRDLAPLRVCREPWSVEGPRALRSPFPGPRPLGGRQVAPSPSASRHYSRLSSTWPGRRLRSRSCPSVRRCRLALVCRRGAGDDDTDRPAPRITAIVRRGA